MQDNEITVSVALVVYNHEKYVIQAIESILMQDVDFSYEIIVGDDKSTDRSREILLGYKEKYPERITLLFQDENVGGTKNIYDLFMKSKGKYIAVLEGDDYWLDRKKLQKQVDFLENNNEYLGVSHLIEARDISGKYISTQPSSPKIVGKDATVELFLKGIYFSAVATVFRNFFKDTKADYSIYYKAHKYVGDLTLCMILLDKGRIKVLNEAMSAYRSRSTKGESNYNSIRNSFQQYNDHIQLINAINKHFDFKYNFSREYIERSAAIFFSSIRHGEFHHFHNTFKLIPLKTRVLFYFLLPIKLVNNIFTKLVSKTKF
ncbi:MAG: glycosyltransferase family 2 protein [Eubacteriales bacterium]